MKLVVSLLILTAVVLSALTLRRYASIPETVRVPVSGPVETMHMPARADGATTPGPRTFPAFVPVPMPHAFDSTRAQRVANFHFERAIISPVTHELPIQVDVADVTGDGRNDVVMTLEDENEIVVRIHEQRIDGTLQQSFEHRMFFQVRTNGSLEVADLDRDDIAEIIVGVENGLVVLSKTVDGYAVSRYDGAIQTGGIIALDAGGGLLDVFAQSPENGAEIYFGDGRGGFPRTQLRQTSRWGYSFMEVTDFTGDGHQDLVMLGYSVVSVFPFVPRHGLGEPMLIQPASLYSAWGMTVADINKDDYSELILTEQGNHLLPKGVRIYYGGPQGLLTGEAFLPVEGAYQHPGAVQVADLDGNGYRDIVVMMNSNDEMGYFLQGPDGFDDIVLQKTDDNPWTSNVYRNNSFKIADINSDGCPDIVLAELSSSFRVFYGRNCVPYRRVTGGPLPPRRG